jgi:trehalose-phosphatase
MQTQQNQSAQPKDPMHESSGVEHTAIIDPQKFDAILFDLDGVVTRTAAVHAAAWKQVFDVYLGKRAKDRGETFQPFDSVSDYQRYVDGKPRSEGVRSFLASRAITLPEGQPNDPPECATVSGLGNAKQACFLALLYDKGVEVYDTTVAFIRQAKAHSLKVAVISSSKNCARVLEAAGLTDLFEARVDGVERERLGLQGKPHPAVFLEAAKRLGVSPARTAIVEDAVAGVQAGRGGQFAYVIGIGKNERAKHLEAHGADIVVPDLSALTICHHQAASKEKTVPIVSLPGALEHVEDLVSAAGQKRLVIFLDYDGTLTPIVARAEDAHLSSSMRATLIELARTFPVAIVSGRDVEDVRRHVALQHLYYAGSHGFEITGPHGFHRVHEAAETFLGDLDQAEVALRQQLDRIAGAWVERKRFAIAVHFRQVSQGHEEAVAAMVTEVQQAHPRLRQTGGKKVFELRPSLDWHKGKALFWLLDVMELAPEAVWPLYIGDDVTDEDAFRVLRHIGVGIVVIEDSDHATAARYALADTQAVRTFLQTLISRAARGRQP